MNGTTIGEMLERVQALYSKGVRASSSRLSTRHIYSKYKSVRKMLISQQIRKRQKISDWNYIVLPCVEVIRVPSHECSCLGHLGCDVWRTKFPLPKILTDLNKHMIDFVMTIDNGDRIEEFTREAVLYASGNKYTAKKNKWVLEKNHLYFTAQKSPGIVKIKLLPEDPIEAAKYPSFCEECQDCVDCTPYTDKPSYLDGELEEPLVQLCVQELIGQFSAGREDKSNDSSDNLIEEGK
jgi:hypothetical protein